MGHLESIGDLAHRHFQSKNQAREGALALSREALRSSANAIRAVHRDDFSRADDLIASAKGALKSAVDALAPHPDVLYAGFVQDAQKEYAEAVLTYALIQGAALPGPDDLGVTWQAYLNGLGEAVGELRRYTLDKLRHGDLQRGEGLLQAMDDIYDLLVTIDYPDSMTGGLRRTTDLMRGVLEKTRGDLTVAARQDQLERSLREVEQRFSRADE